ncbi:Nad dependent epimerase dehydratase [Paragonimus skrjabini miyazakii]|uniref:Nad dependent epimerase dehydratase n=1 Tax=Paragonimus skrjabini miyazakii TaxID=59628 RepID=A0A8S9YZF7_9TREM|nr:Nad dependent epimerase dehydratase [Paragonimus skrjabini miyazakii]
MLNEEQPMVSKHGPLLVIGAGVGRTGTTSLKTALEIIYGQPCYHMFELFKPPRDDSSKWVEVDRLVSQSTDGKIDPQLLYEIFDGYRCTVDFPSCSYYRQLMQTYPDAKVVLTIRDKHSWLESARATILPRRDIRCSNWRDAFFDTRNRWKAVDMHRAMFERAFGQEIDTTNDEMLLAAYERWNEQVIQNVPVDRLLVFDVKEGWEPLCKFLNVSVRNQPFPHVNERTEMVKRMKNE